MARPVYGYRRRGSCGPLVVGAFALLRRVLLDMQAPEELREEVRQAIESEGDNRISDLHVWAVGPGIYAAEIALVSSDPLDADHYGSLLPKRLGIVHATVATRQCSSNCRNSC